MDDDAQYLTSSCMCFFFNDTATTEIYTLSLHDALPICARPDSGAHLGRGAAAHSMGLRAHPGERARRLRHAGRDRKSTRLNSSHANISYAVFCLKTKKTLSIPSSAPPYLNRLHISCFRI